MYLTLSVYEIGGHIYWDDQQTLPITEDILQDIDENGQTKGPTYTLVDEQRIPVFLINLPGK